VADLKPYDGPVIPDQPPPDPAKLKPYDGKVIGDTPNATIGDVAKELGASAIESVGEVAHAGGEYLARGINELAGTDLRATNPLGPAAEAVRSTITPGGEAARGDTFKGDILDPSTWEVPKTGSGLAMGVAQGAGSLASTLVPLGGLKYAGMGERALVAAGAGLGFGATSGQASTQVRDEVGKMTHEQLLKDVPAYQQAIDSGMDRGAAKDKIANDSALYAGLISGVFGAMQGGVNAKLLEDFVAKKGIAALLGRTSEKGVVRAATGGAVGAVGEGIQEGMEQVGQNVGENIGRGKPAGEDVTRDTFGNVVLGAAVGGPIGLGAGAIAPHGAAAAPAPTGEVAPPAPGTAPAPTGGITPDQDDLSLRRMERQAMLDRGRASGQKLDNDQLEALSNVRDALNEQRSENGMPPVPKAEWTAIVQGMMALEPPTPAKPSFPFITSQAATAYAAQMERKTGQPFEVSPHPTVAGRFAVHPVGQAPVAPQTRPKGIGNDTTQQSAPGAGVSTAGAAGVTASGAANVQAGQEIGSGQGGGGEAQSAAGEQRNVEAPSDDAERRLNDAKRKRIDQMTPEEMRRELLTSPKAGIGNQRAYDEAPRRAVQASLDLDGLKWVNDNMGHGAGDELIAKLGEALRDANIEGYHVSGDEFVAQFDDHESGQSALDGIRNRLNNATVTVELPDGSTITKKGVGFSYGLGKDLGNAEQGLQREKSDREKSGARSARGGEPGGVARTPAAGKQDQGREAAAEVTGEQPGNNRADTGKSPGKAGESPDLEALFDEAAAETREGKKPDATPPVNPEPAATVMDAERALANGDRVFLVHEQDEEPEEVSSVDRLKGYTADQILIERGGNAAEGETLTPEQEQKSVVDEVRREITGHLDDIAAAEKELNSGKPLKDAKRAQHQQTVKSMHHLIAAKLNEVENAYGTKAAEALQAEVFEGRKGATSLTVNHYWAGRTVDTDAHEAATSEENGKAPPTQGQIDAGNYEKGHTAVAGMPISIENPEGSWRFKYDVKRLEQLQQRVAKIEADTVSSRKMASNAARELRSALDSLEAGEPVKAVESMKEAGLNLRHQWPAMDEVIDEIIEQGWHVKMPYHYGYFLKTVAPDKDHVDVAIKPGTPKDYGGPVHVIAQLKADGTYDEPKVFMGWAKQADARAAYVSSMNDSEKAEGLIGGIRTFAMDGFKKWVYDSDLTKKSPVALKKKAEPPKVPPVQPPTTGSLFDEQGKVTPEALAKKGKPPLPPKPGEAERKRALRWMQERLNSYVESDRGPDEFFTGGQGHHGNGGSYEFLGPRVTVTLDGQTPQVFSRKQFEDEYATWVEEAKRAGNFESQADRRVRENREAAERFKPGDTVGANTISLPLKNGGNGPYIAGEALKVVSISPERAVLEVTPYAIGKPVEVATEPRWLNQWYGDPYGTPRAPKGKIEDPRKAAKEAKEKAVAEKQALRTAQAQVYAALAAHPDLVSFATASIEDFNARMKALAAQRVKDQVDADETRKGALAALEVDGRMLAALRREAVKQQKALAAEKREAEKSAPKLKNTGDDLRRHWELVKAELKAKNETEGIAGMNRIFAATTRADLFAGAIDDEAATPATVKYGEIVRDTVRTFKDWSVSRNGPFYNLNGSYGGWREGAASKIEAWVRGRAYTSLKNDAGESSSSGDMTVQERLSLLSDYADKYLTNVRQMVDLVRGQTKVAEAAKRVSEAIWTQMDPGRMSQWTALDDKNTTALGKSLAASGVIDTDRAWKIHQVSYPTANLIRNEDSIKVEDQQRRKPLIPPRLESVVRDLPATVRTGNVTPQQFKDEFGFSDVGFGSWVKSAEDQAHLNHAWDAFADLAAFVGIDRKQIGFGGRLHFTLGALGHGAKAAATFHPMHPGPNGSVQVINLTKTKGDGTVAHEWFHALDFFLSANGSRGALSELVSGLKETYDASGLQQIAIDGLRKRRWMMRNKAAAPIDNAYALLDYYRSRGAAATEYKRNADAMDPKYWGNDAELMARAWEAFVSDTLGGTDNYLVNPGWVGDGMATPPTYKGTPYPRGEERKRFADWYKALLGSLTFNDRGIAIDPDKWQELKPKFRDDYREAAKQGVKGIDEALKGPDQAVRPHQGARSRASRGLRRGPTRRPSRTSRPRCARSRRPARA
jgi:GGDEF domain-containing protein